MAGYYGQGRNMSSEFYRFESGGLGNDPRESITAVARNHVGRLRRRSAGTWFRDRSSFRLDFPGRIFLPGARVLSRVRGPFAPNRLPRNLVGRSHSRTRRPTESPRTIPLANSASFGPQRAERILQPGAIESRTIRVLSPIGFPRRSPQTQVPGKALLNGFYRRQAVG